MENIAENRKEIFLKIISSWDGRRLLCDEYFHAPLSITQLAMVLEISDAQLKATFNNIWSLASEGISLKEGFFAAKLDSGYQVRAQLNGQQKMAEFASEPEAIDFFINAFPNVQPLEGFETAIEDIFIDFSLRKFGQYVLDDPMLYSPVVERAAYVGIDEERMKTVVKNCYVRVPYVIESEDDRGIRQKRQFATESDMVDYLLR